MRKMTVRRQKTPPGYYTVAEVAEILRVTTRTVHTYLHVDGLPYKKVGKYNLIANEDLSRWIDKQTGMSLTEWKRQSD
ncbi:MAG: helix-turn-helix domain-containing protein [Solobacterium sp.]|nr:helix-turn-helix domain-containing protein [Solobacterium sp.]